MALPEEPLDMSYRPTDLIGEAQVAENPVKRSKAEELLQKIYSTNVPEPVFDQAKADRLKRMGRVNNMGKSISVLADIAASGMGANVKRRQDDGTAARLFQSYENNLDKYKNDQDVYSLRKMSKSLDDAKIGLSEARREEQLDFQNRKQADWMKAKEADNKLNWAKWSATYDLNNRKFGLDSKKADTDANYKNQRLRIEQQKADKPTAAELAANKPFDPVQVTDKFGNSVKLDQGQWDNLYQSALKDSNFMDDNMKALISKYKELPDGGIKQIARAYYDYNKTKDYNASQKEAEDRARKERGLSTDPVSTQSAPAKTVKQSTAPKNKYGI